MCCTFQVFSIWSSTCCNFLTSQTVLSPCIQACPAPSFPAVLLTTPSGLQVKSKKRECQLHRDSPLGDTLLECYSCAGRNAFALGFVPVAAESSVVLLCRDHAPSAPGVRELGLDLALWQPLIEDRAFVPWLVKVPTEQACSWPCHAPLAHCLQPRHVSGCMGASALQCIWREAGIDVQLWTPLGGLACQLPALCMWVADTGCEVQEVLRARHLTVGQVSRLEEAWKADPAATLDKLSTPSPDEEPAPVALKCEPPCPPACCMLHIPAASCLRTPASSHMRRPSLSSLCCPAGSVLGGAQHVAGMLQVTDTCT